MKKILLMIKGAGLVCLLLGMVTGSAIGATCELSPNARPTNAGNSTSHPISVVDADVYVNRFSTTMRLKAFAEDLELLQGVEALDDGFYDPDELRDATQDHAKYLQERIELINSAGEKIPAKIIDVVDFEIPEGGIRSGTLMEHQMGFELEFSYDQPPEHLTINQRMVADGQLLPSELKILLKQAGSDTPYVHMMKPDTPETFRFDWDRPALSEDASEKEWEEWFSDQREKTLGITSYSSVYSFIYITRYEVRHEVLVPLANLATFIEFEHADPSFLSIAEQDKAQAAIEKFFSVGNPVEIDGVVVQPKFDRVDFYGLDLRDFAVQAERRRISMANGRVGVIMSYSTKGTPSNVRVTWDKFNTSIKTVDSIVFPMDEDVQKTEFTMFLKDNTYEWEAPESQPLPPVVGVEAPPVARANLPHVSLMLFGGAIVLLILHLLFKLNTVTLTVIASLLGISGMICLPLYSQMCYSPFQPKFEIEDENAEQVFAQLHKNMFRAFDYHHESDIYDALAKSVDGELLRKLYLDINGSLRMQEQGGAISKVQDVQLEEAVRVFDGNEVEGSDNLGFAIRSKWNLIGTVEHWGHIHQRTNQYDAVFDVDLRNDEWKITSMDVKDETQGPVKTSLREF